MFRMPPFPPELSGSPGALPSAAGPLQHRGQRRDARAQRGSDALKSGILFWEDREKPPEVSPLLKSPPEPLPAGLGRLTRGY